MPYPWCTVKGMDDVTRKRLESERASFKNPQAVMDGAIGSLKASMPSNYDAHNAELAKLGYPPEAVGAFGSLFLGMAVGNMARNGVPIEHVLDLHDLVATVKESEAYDLCCDVEFGDLLEECWARIEAAMPRCEEHPDEHVLGLGQVFEWARLMRSSIAEMTFSLEDHYGAMVETHPLAEIRETARKATRFMAESLYLGMTGEDPRAS